MTRNKTDSTVPDNEDVGVFLGSITLSFQRAALLLQEICARDKRGWYHGRSARGVSWWNAVCGGEAIRGCGEEETCANVVSDYALSTQPTHHTCSVGGIAGETQPGKGPRGGAWLSATVGTKLARGCCFSRRPDPTPIPPSLQPSDEPVTAHHTVCAQTRITS